MKDKKNALGVLILCIATIVCISFGFYAKDVIKAPSTTKTVEISVINNEDCKVFSITTDGTTLRDAAEEINLVEGEEGQYGLYVKTVNGYTANEQKQEWWCITKENEPVFEGIDNIKISNGDKYEITLKGM